MKLSIKRVIVLSALILMFTVCFGIKKGREYFDLANLRYSNQMAEYAAECMKEWCKTQGTEPEALAEGFRGGRAYDVTEDGEGFAHFLHNYENLNDGMVYIGVNVNGGKESLFYQWSRCKNNRLVGQYPDGVSCKDITEENKLSFGSYFQPKM